MKPEITEQQLLERSWIRIEKDSFTGKLVWVKDKYKTDSGTEGDAFVYYPIDRKVKYFGSGMMFVEKKVITIQDLNSFYSFIRQS